MSKKKTFEKKHNFSVGVTSYSFYTLEKLTEFIEEAEKQAYETVKNVKNVVKVDTAEFVIDSFRDPYGDPDSEIQGCIKYWVEETDAQYEARLKREKKQRENNKKQKEEAEKRKLEKERKEYERLKKKFGE